MLSSCFCTDWGANGNGKGKVHPRTDHEVHWGEWRYSYTLSFTLALDAVDGQRHAPAFISGKTRCPLCRRLGGPQGWSRDVRKISPSSGFDPWTDQRVASRYTDWDIVTMRGLRGRPRNCVQSFRCYGWGSKLQWIPYSMGRLCWDGKVWGCYMKDKCWALFQKFLFNVRALSS